MAGMVEKTYSDAVFQLGIEENCLDLVCSEISEVSRIFDDSPDFVKVLCAPTVTFEEKSEMLNRVLKGKISDYTMNFLLVLTEKNRAGYLGKIAAQLKEAYNEHNGILEVSATTAEPLSSSAREKLVKKLESITAKKISLVEKTDRSIIGGIILDYGNTRLDSSVKSRLDGIRTQIKSVIA